MTNTEIKTWIKTRETKYLMSYTGVKTVKGIEKFETAFIAFLIDHTDFGGIKLSMVAFKKSLIAAKAA